MESSKRTLLLLAHDYSWGKMETNIKKVLGEDAKELKTCRLQPLRGHFIVGVSDSPPMMAGLTTKASSPTTFH